MTISPEQALSDMGAVRLQNDDGLAGIADLAAESDLNIEGPQPLLRELPKGEPYPIEALGPLRAVVEAVHDKTQAPIAIAAQSALAVASLAVQGFANVNSLGGPVPCSLYCLTIAQSGERKSGCDKLLMQAVRAHEADAAQEYKTDLAVYETEQKIWEAKHNRLIRDVAGGKGEKACDARAELDAMPLSPEPPLSPNKTATDPTFEGLVKLFAIGQPALGLFTDEAGGFIGGHAMNSDNRLKTCAGLSGLWDGTPMNRTRAGDGSNTFRGRRLAVHMMVQPVAARPLLADPVARGQGILARFLICEPESAIGSRTRRGSKPESDTAISDFGVMLRTLLETPPPLREESQNELDPPLLILIPAASDILLDYYEDTEGAQAPDGEFSQVRPYASKSAEQAVRIAGVLTLWKNPQATEISSRTMADGIDLARYYLSEAKRLADAAVISEEISRAELLNIWLQEKWPDPYVLPGDIIQKGPNSLRESPKVKAAISILVRHGWLIPLPDGEVVQGKKRKEAYRIVRPLNVV